MPTPITFHIYQGGQLVRSETLAQDVIKIGKLDSSHLKIEDDGVSRMHSVIERSPTGEVFIIDLGSATGTIVNGQRGTASSERRILERDGNAEQSHDAVAGEIANRAALLFHDSRHHAGHTPHDGESRLFARPFRKGRETDQVGKEYRHLATFALQLRCFKLGRHFFLPLRSAKSAT